MATLIRIKLAKFKVSLVVRLHPSKASVWILFWLLT